MSDEVQYKLSLQIELDESVPFPLVQVGLTESEDGSALIAVVATNWAASETGAAAVASFLREAADAIDDELGVSRLGGRLVADTVSKEPKRPRFNPQPRKPGMRPSSEH